MKTQDTDIAKKNKIAQAAFEVFSENGFKGTSMQKIATRADMSRPALYLHFENKEAVARYLTRSFFDQAIALLQEGLRPELSAFEGIKLVYDVFNINGVTKIFLDTPHGAELMNAKSAFGADLFVEGEARLTTVLAKWLEGQVLSGRIECQAPMITARAIVSAHNGVKTPPVSYESYLEQVSILTEMFGAALMTKKA